MLPVLKNTTPKDIALMALKDSGYEDFRALAMRVASNPKLYMSKDEEMVAKELGLPVEVWKQLQYLDEYRQEQTIAIIYNNAATPMDVERVVRKLVQIAHDPEDEANALAAQRIYFSLLSKIGALPKEEKAPVIGFQGNVLLMNQPSAQEVMPIGTAKVGGHVIDAGKEGYQESHEAEK